MNQTFNRKHFFQHVYDNLVWSPSIRSGGGSSLRGTIYIRQALAYTLKKYNVCSMLDAACGDWNWMHTMDLGEIDYLGIDIVHDVIQHNLQKYKTKTIDFKTMDIVEETPPQVDLIFSRDTLVHNTCEDNKRIISNWVSSGSKYLLCTQFPCYGNDENFDRGHWRPIDFTKEPYNFPKPMEIFSESNKSHVHEGMKSNAGKKCLALWPIDSLKL